MVHECDLTERHNNFGKLCGNTYLVQLMEYMTLKYGNKMRWTLNQLINCLFGLVANSYINVLHGQSWTHGRLSSTAYISLIYTYTHMRARCRRYRLVRSGQAFFKSSVWLGLRNGRSRLGFEWNSIDQTNIRRTHSCEYQSCPRVRRWTRGSVRITFFAVFANRIMTLWYVGLCIW